MLSRENLFFFNDCKDPLLVDNNKLLILHKYFDVFLYWNKYSNLMSRVNAKTELVSNIEDSVKGGEFLKGVLEFCDAGTGGGLPGIPIAIMYPNVKVGLIESCRKKSSFLRKVKSDLCLKNVSVINERVESYVPQKNIVSRAAFSPNKLNLLQNMLVKGGHLYLWVSAQSKNSFLAAASNQGMRKMNEFEYSLRGKGKRTIIVLKKV